MFEVEFRPRQRSDARSERCSKLVMLWFTIIAIICVVFFFLSYVWASVITVVVLLSMMWFTWYYFHSAPPETEPIELHHADHAAVEGLSPSDIAEIPSFSFQRNVGDDFKDLNDSNGGVGWLQCAVCIATVKEGEMVRQLSACKHVFHLMCIDKWLGSHSTCPMCRADVKTGELSSEPPLPPV